MGAGRVGTFGVRTRYHSYRALKAEVTTLERDCPNILRPGMGLSVSRLNLPCRLRLTSGNKVAVGPGPSPSLRR